MRQFRQWESVTAGSQLNSYHNEGRVSHFLYRATGEYKRHDEHQNGSHHDITDGYSDVPDGFASCNGKFSVAFGCIVR